MMKQVFGSFIKVNSKSRTLTFCSPSNAHNSAYHDSALEFQNLILVLYYRPTIFLPLNKFIQATLQGV